MSYSIGHSHVTLILHFVVCSFPDSLPRDYAILCYFCLVLRRYGYVLHRSKREVRKSSSLCNELKLSTDESDASSVTSSQPESELIYSELEDL